MKRIVLIPTKNEDWILDFTLSSIHQHVDHVIIADQHSIDATRSICSKYTKVTLIDNNEIGHSNKVRWKLLDEARKIPGNNLIINIDADELLSKESFEILHNKALQFGAGNAFSFPWIQLWKKPTHHRVDGPWKNNWKAIAFYDDRLVEYEKKFVINDHTSRIPTLPTLQLIPLENCPLLHLQFLAWKKTYIKQAWYKCSELIATPNKYRYINNKYSPSNDSTSVTLDEVPKDWLRNIEMPSNIYTLDDITRRNEILQWFNVHTVEFFEHLDIWNDLELFNFFIEKTGRKPKVLQYPKILVELNKMRHWIKNIIK